MNALEEEGRRLAKTMETSPEDIRNMTMQTGRHMMKQFRGLPDGPSKVKLLALGYELEQVWREADDSTLFAWLAVAWAERH